MKTLIAAALLLALASPASAETRTCIGRVKIDVIKTSEELYPKGSKQFSIGGCVLESLALQKHALHICPLGSWCRIVGPYAGDDAIESIDSIIKIDPEGDDMWTCSTRSCYRKLSAQCAKINPKGRNTVPGVCLAADAARDSLKAARQGHR